MHYHVFYQCASYYTRNFFHAELSGSYFDLLQGEFVFRYRTHHYLTPQIHRLSFVPLSTFSTLILFWRIRGNSLIQGQLIFWMTLIYIYYFTCSWHAIFMWIFSTLCRTVYANILYIEFYMNYAFSNLSKLFLSVFDSTKRLGHKNENFWEKKFQSVYMYTALKTSHKVTCN